MKVKFSIVGCGRVAQRHAEHIHILGELVSVCDVVAEKADTLAEKYGAKAYHSIDELLEHTPPTDVIAVCSPNGLHAEHTIKALQAGFHVICEKPMAITVHDCQAMIQQAEKANKKLFIVKQNRFNPPVAAVKRLIEEEKLGEIFSVQLNCFWNRGPGYYKDSWRGTKRVDGGTLFTQFSHFIDLLYWMIGDVQEAGGYIANLAHQGIIEFEDTGVIAVRFTNGAVGTINYTVNSFDRNMEGSLTLFGKKGTVKIGGQYLNELEYQDIEGYRIENLPTGNPPNHYGEYQGSMSNHDKVYQNVIDTLQGNGTIATEGFEGLKTVEIIEKIYSSVRQL